MQDILLTMSVTPFLLECVSQNEIHYVRRIAWLSRSEEHRSRCAWIDGDHIRFHDILVKIRFSVALKSVLEPPREVLGEPVTDGGTQLAKYASRIRIVLGSRYKKPWIGRITKRSRCNCAFSI